MRTVIHILVLFYVQLEACPLKKKDRAYVQNLMRFYTVSFGSRKYDRTYCPATPFHTNWLITAGYCYAKALSVIAVLDYSIILNSDTDTISKYHGGYTLPNGDPVWPVLKTIPHPYFSFEDNVNASKYDVQLLYTRRTIIPNKNTNFVTLPPHRPISEDLNGIYPKTDDCYSLGRAWEWVKYNVYFDYHRDTYVMSRPTTPNTSVELVCNYQKILKDKYCRYRLQHSWFGRRFIFTGPIICTKYYPGTNDGCFTIPGNALVCGNGIIEGVLSGHRLGCGNARSDTSSYIRVDQFLEWIYEHTGVW